MRKIFYLIAILIACGCQKNSIESRIEGNWEGDVAELLEFSHDKYVRLAMFEGEVYLDMTKDAEEEGWQEGFGTYTIDNNIITFDIEIGATPKSSGVKNITYAEIIENKHENTYENNKILLKVYWTLDGVGGSDKWIWFHRTDRFKR